jgi:hypothetical protein
VKPGGGIKSAPPKEGRFNAAASVSTRMNVHKHQAQDSIVLLIEMYPLIAGANHSRGDNIGRDHHVWPISPISVRYTSLKQSPKEQRVLCRAVAASIAEAAATDGLDAVNTLEAVAGSDGAAAAELRKGKGGHETSAGGKSSRRAVEVSLLRMAPVARVDHATHLIHQGVVTTLQLWLRAAGAGHVNGHAAGAGAASATAGAAAKVREVALRVTRAPSYTRLLLRSLEQHRLEVEGLGLRVAAGRTEMEAKLAQKKEGQHRQGQGSGTDNAGQQQAMGMKGKNITGQRGHHQTMRPEINGQDQRKGAPQLLRSSTAVIAMCVLGYCCILLLVLVCPGSMLLYPDMLPLLLQHQSRDIKCSLTRLLSECIM